LQQLGYKTTTHSCLGLLLSIASVIIRAIVIVAVLLRVGYERG